MTVIMMRIYHPPVRVVPPVLLLAVVVVGVFVVVSSSPLYHVVEAFVQQQQQQHLHTSASTSTSSRLSLFGNSNNNDINNDENENDETTTTTEKQWNLVEEWNGLMQNMDSVIDDFVYKRMGAGEQWYGKRKYNPSGKIDGKYNGMGQSDLLRIEIARVQKEEIELKKQRRLLEMEEQGKKKKWGE